MSPVIAWRNMDPRRFERAVQLLVRDQISAAVSIDGAGGDQAQDLRWESPDGLVIFEVKAFFDRLTNSRKRQIKSSFTHAMEMHKPVRWVLIAGFNPTPAELTWLSSLAAEDVVVNVEWWGRDWLDGCLAGREDVRSYLEGTDYQLLVRAKELGLEREAMRTGDEYGRRMRALEERVDSISPYWTWRPTTDVDGTTALVLTPKSAESAHEDPIALTTTFSFPESDPEGAEAAAALQRALRVGGDVDVPGRFVTAFGVTTSSEATGRLIGDSHRDVDRLLIRGIPDSAGLPITVTVTATLGERSLAADVIMRERLGGSAGATLRGGDSCGAFEVSLVLDKEGRSEFNIQASGLLGLPPHEVLPMLHLLAVLEPGVTLELKAGPADLGSFAVHRGWPLDLKPLARVVMALKVLQDYTGRLLPIPDLTQMQRGDVDEIVHVARALTGQSVRVSDGPLEATIRPGMARSFLEAVPEAGGSLYMWRPVELQVGDVAITVKDVGWWAPGAQLSNRAALLRAAKGASPIARFTVPDSGGIFMIRAPESVPEDWQKLDTFAEL